MKIQDNQRNEIKINKIEIRLEYDFKKINKIKSKIQSLTKEVKQKIKFKIENIYCKKRYKN